MKLATQTSKNKTKRIPAPESQKVQEVAPLCAMTSMPQCTSATYFDCNLWYTYTPAKSSQRYLLSHSTTRPKNTMPFQNFEGAKKLRATLLSPLCRLRACCLFSTSDVCQRLYSSKSTHANAFFLNGETWKTIGGTPGSVRCTAMLQINRELKNVRSFLAFWHGWKTKQKHLSIYTIYKSGKWLSSQPWADSMHSCCFAAAAGASRPNLNANCSVQIAPKVPHTIFELVACRNLNLR